MTLLSVLDGTSKTDVVTEGTIGVSAESMLTSGEVGEQVSCKVLHVGRGEMSDCVLSGSVIETASAL